MHTYSIPSSSYTYAFDKDGRNDHVDFGVSHDPARNEYTASLKLLPQSRGNGRGVSHTNLQVWITLPPATVGARSPRAPIVAKDQLQGRSAYWLVPSVATDVDRSFDVRFVLQSTKPMRIEFNLRSDQLKRMVSLQQNLEAVATSARPALPARGPDERVAAAGGQA